MANRRWIEQIFDCQQALTGGVVRRALADVHQYASLDLLVAEVEKRKWHILMIGRQVIILCNGGDLKLLR